MRLINSVMLVAALFAFAKFAVLPVHLAGYCSESSGKYFSLLFRSEKEAGCTPPQFDMCNSHSAFSQQENSTDWHQWMGPSRNGVWNSDNIIPRIPSSGLIEKWRAPISSGFSGPVVSEGKVVVADFVLTEGRVMSNASARELVKGNERLLCFDELTGELLWKYRRPVEYNVSYSSGPRVTPIIANDTVTFLGTNGDLVCLDMKDGSLLWSRSCIDDFESPTPYWGHSSHPIVFEDAVICLVGGQKGGVVAIDALTGDTKWRAIPMGEPGYCPPSIVELGGRFQLLIWTPENLYSLSPANGSILWQTKLHANSGMSVTQPQVSGEHIFVTGIGTPPSLFRFEESPKPMPVLLWQGKPKGFASANSTPIIYEGVIYGVNPKGELVASDLETGIKLWATFRPTTGSRRKSYSTAFIVKVNDKYFLFNESGELVLAELTRDGYVEYGRDKLIEPTINTYGRDVVWSHPAFANGHVLIRNDKELIRYSLDDRDYE